MLWAKDVLGSPGPLRTAWLAFSRTLTKSQVEQADLQGETACWEGL